MPNPDKAVKCRHCGEPFMPLPGKPGYINECPDCLYDKTVPFQPKGLTLHEAEQAKRLEKGIAQLRRQLAKIGVGGSHAEEAIAAFIEAARKHPATH